MALISIYNLVLVLVGFGLVNYGLGLGAPLALTPSLVLIPSWFL